MGTASEHLPDESVASRIDTSWYRPVLLLVRLACRAAAPLSRICAIASNELTRYITCLSVQLEAVEQSYKRVLRGIRYVCQARVFAVYCYALLHRIAKFARKASAHSQYPVSLSDSPFA